MVIAPLKSDLPEQPLTDKRWKRAAYLALSVLCVAYLVTSLDNTIINVALPILVRDLHATVTQLEWVVDSYVIVFAGLLLPAGILGDRIGRKAVFIAGLLIFGAGSAASAFSGTANLLIISRAAMGVGAAAIMPSTLSILTAVFRRADERKGAIGIWSATSAIGVAAGPIAGGWLLAHYWWGSVFLINVPLSFLAAVAALIVVPGSRDPESRRSDPIGAILSVVGMGALVGAIIEAPTRGWHDPLIIGVGIAGVVALIVMILWEKKSSHPMLVMDTFHDSRFSAGMAALALVALSLMGAMFILTQYFQFSLGYSPFAAGLRILPVAGVIAVAAPLATFLDRFIGSKIIVTVGMLLVGVGLFQISTSTISDGFPHALVGVILLGGGAGLAFPLATDAVMGALPSARLGVGSATNSSAVQLGGALGVAIIGSVLASRYQGYLIPLLHGHPMPAAARSAILGSLGGALMVAHIAGGSAGHLLAVAARHAFIEGMSASLKVGAAVSVAAGLGSLAFLPARRGASHLTFHHPHRRAGDRPPAGQDSQPAA